MESKIDSIDFLNLISSILNFFYPRTGDLENSTPNLLLRCQLVSPREHSNRTTILVHREEIGTGMEFYEGLFSPDKCQSTLTVRVSHAACSVQISCQEHQLHLTATCNCRFVLHSVGVRPVSFT